MILGYGLFSLLKNGFDKPSEYDGWLVLDNAFSTDFARVYEGFEKKVSLRDRGEVYILHARIRAGKQGLKLLKDALYNGKDDFDGFGGTISHFEGPNVPSSIESWWDASDKPTKIFTGKGTDRGGLTLTTSLVDGEDIIYICADWAKRGPPP